MFCITCNSWNPFAILPALCVNGNFCYEGNFIQWDPIFLMFYSSGGLRQVGKYTLACALRILIINKMKMGNSTQENITAKKSFCKVEFLAIKLGNTSKWLSLGHLFLRAVWICHTSSFKWVFFARAAPIWLNCSPLGLVSYKHLADWWDKIERSNLLKCSNLWGWCS